MTRYTLHHGDCRAVMASMEANSVDAIVTDPPYGLSFMGKEWDHGVPGVEFWKEALRVLKPGGHILAAGGTRTFHRLTVAIEDAGFEIRDCISWMYGSGFPKSHNLHDEWHGWGTALKPAWEPFILARKPLSGTVADTVLTHGTGALNIDGCRIATSDDFGRWPANVLLDESSAEMLDAQSGMGGNNWRKSKKPNTHKSRGIYHDYKGQPDKAGGHSDSGGASRFFYVAKASASEREAGLSDMVNHHPTVKPITLMRYLVRLITPPDGVVLDPFMGSGSTGCGAMLEGKRFIGIDITADYVAIAERRLAYWAEQNPMDV